MDDAETLLAKIIAAIVWTVTRFACFKDFIPFPFALKASITNTKFLIHLVEHVILFGVLNFADNKIVTNSLF